MLYIGIDLGTSAVKLLLMDARGNIEKIVSKEYPISFPRPGWAEQNPADWLRAVTAGIGDLTRDFDKTQIAGIGCGGQMHGLVALDENDRVIRPAILWNDGRTAREVEYLNHTIGKKRLGDYTANIAFAGFTAPKLLWLRENEPENFARIRKIMLPKDYINYMLTGVHCTDLSDASGMLLLNVAHRRWSPEMMEICHIGREQLPDLYESYQVVGTLLPGMAERLGLAPTVRVVAGAGDNAAAAVGTGTIGNGKCNLSLGTSGTVFVSSERFKMDKLNALHAFAHADGHYHLMGCILSAAACNAWWVGDILGTGDNAAEQASITDQKLGRNPVYFLPYLMGERSPINDVDARGTFIGMTMNSGRADMTQAVFEGVAFAIRDCFEVAKSIGITIGRSTICGGGAKSTLWKKIMANVLNIELDVVKTEEGPGYGAAMLAAVGCGEYESVAACADALIKIAGTVVPDPEIAARYEERYRQFQKIYPAVKSLFPEIK